MKGDLEFRSLAPEHARALGAFFEALLANGDDRHFHPHELTRTEAGKLCERETKDSYYVVVTGGEVVGYGMLRGWEEGWEIPSLGIAVSPGHRGTGLGRALMQFLHAVARFRGAQKIRLKVATSNQSALRLYESCGYAFETANQDEQIGFLLL